MTLATLTAPPDFKQATREQQALLLALQRDQVALETPMARDLRRAFRELGQRVARAYLATFGRREFRAARVPAAAKQDPFLEETADQIVRAALLGAWTESSFVPVYQQLYLRGMQQTVGTVNNVLGLNVSLPATLERRMLADGGQRVGLVDIQGETRDAVFRGLAEGRALEETTDAIAERIRGKVSAGRFVHAGPEYRARLIARTESSIAQNLASVATYEVSELFSGVLVFDGTDFDQPCIDAAGQIWTFERAEADPIAHPNCQRKFTPNRS